MREFYSSRRLPDVRHPHIKIPVFNIAGSMLVISSVLLLVWLNTSYLITAYELGMGILRGGMPYLPSLHSIGELPDTIFQLGSLAIASFWFAATIAVISLAALKFSGRRIFAGINQLAADEVDVDAPKNFRDSRAVMKDIDEGKILADPEAGAVPKAFFGANVRFRSPVARRVSADVAKQTSRPIRQVMPLMIWPLLLISALYLVQAHLVDHVDLPAQVSTFIMRLSFAETTVFITLPFLILLAFTVVKLICDFVFLKMITPRDVPETDTNSRSEDMRTSTPMHSLLPQLRDKLEELGWDKFRNRRYHMGSSESSSVALNEASEFDHIEMIEQQPQPITNPHMKAALFRLTTGWLFILTSIFCGFFLLPDVHRAALAGDSLPPMSKLFAPISTIILTFAIVYCWKRGHLMMTEGERLLNSVWFRSPIVVMQLIGTVGRAEIRAGKAQQDSFETSATLSRSEFLARVIATELVTETETLERPEIREIIAMRSTEASRRWRDHAIESLETLCRKKAAPIGLDLQDDGIHEITQGNIAAEAARYKGIERAKLQARAEHLAGQHLNSDPQPKRIRESS